MVQTIITTKVLDVWVVDPAGRVAIIRRKAFANIQLEFDPMIYLKKAALTLTIDGQAGTGWCEVCWNRDYFEFAKQCVVPYGCRERSPLV